MVAPDISPLVLSAEQLIVPVGGFSTRSMAAMRNSGSMPIFAASFSIFSMSCCCSSVMSPPVSGNLKFGLASPGPHQSSVDMVSRHSCQVLRERSVSRFSLGKPISSPNFDAPSPTSMTWPVCSITVFASSETFLISCTPATEPAMRVGPCMQQESSSTTHSSFGSPPSPTLSSLGSSSGPVMTCMTASSVSPPLVSTA